MPYLNHKDELDRDRQEHFEHEHDWLCSRCFKTISADRPPILNLDNCSCHEAGRRASDPNSSLILADLLNDSASQNPSSYPTSNDGSVENPDGPAATGPGNRFLPVAPAIGLNELLHRRRASSDDNKERRAHSIRQWRNNLPLQNREFCGMAIDSDDTAWLRQSTYIIGDTDSIKATQGGSRTASVMLSSHSSSTSSSWPSSVLDPVVEIGAWIDMSASGSQPEQLDEDALCDDDDGI